MRNGVLRGTNAARKYIDDHQWPGDESLKKFVRKTNVARDNFARKTKSAVAIGAMLAPLLVTAPTPATAYDTGSAQSYLLSHADNPWTTMALTTLGASAIPSDYLKTVSGTSAIQFAAPILAITALNQDPRTFGSTDLVAALKSYHTAGQLGDVASLNDDIFGVLALMSAGEPASSSTIADSKNFLLSHQNSDGGWGFTTSSTSDTNMTASAILALRSVGTSAGDDHIHNAAAYLHSAQNDDGGFPYDPRSSFGTASDTSSTAWVVWALKSINIAPTTWTKGNAHTPLSFIESNQTAAGFFEYQHGSGEDAFSSTTTAYAVIALQEKFLPVHSISLNGGGGNGGGGGGGSDSGGNSSCTSSTACFSFRVEGSSETVCRGTVAVTTALDIIKNAKNQCGYTYTIQATSFGPYLTSINSDQASGLKGWLYLVNYVAPNVGAADYHLQLGDSVIWYYGNFDWLPSRVSLSSATISSGASTTATVESFNSGTWSPLTGAIAYFGASQAATDNSGHAQLTPPDGFYQVFAAKDGFVRSDTASLTVGGGGGTIVGLTANVIAGQVKGDGTISFIVNPTSIDFGTIHSGESSTKTVTVSNTGAVNIKIGTNFSGAQALGDNLSLDGAKWGTFQSSLATSNHRDYNLKFDLPAAYSTASGNKTGQLTFWAMNNQ